MQRPAERVVKLTHPTELFSNSSMSSRWRGVRRRGILTSTFTSSSPTPLLRSSGIPLPRRRSVLPLWVPAGIFIITPPSMVGTRTSVPRIALDRLTVISTKRSEPFRSNVLCGSISTTTKRSP